MGLEGKIGFPEEEEEEAGWDDGNIMCGYIISHNFPSAIFVKGRKREISSLSKHILVVEVDVSSTNRTEERKKSRAGCWFFWRETQRKSCVFQLFLHQYPNFTDLEKESLISRALPVLAVIFHVISGGCIRGRKALAVMLFLSLRFLHYTVVVVVVVFLAKKNSRPATAERQRERLVVSHRIGQVGSKKKLSLKCILPKRKTKKKKKKFLTHWK